MNRQILSILGALNLMVMILEGDIVFSKLRVLRAETIAESNSLAKVTDVAVTGEPNDYTFAVTVSSPDTGCDSYADWWEVVTPEGELMYRRVLLHSHIDEQPFERTGGTVAIAPEQPVIVRVHMSADGYSPLAQQGTVSKGFAPVTLPENFATALASVEPLPNNCAF